MFQKKSVSIFLYFCIYRFPYHYTKIVTRKLVVTVLAVMWCVVAAVDLIPFLPVTRDEEEGCSYIPQRAWSLSVITVFNFLPFVVIAFNYLLVWRVAAEITFQDFALHRSLAVSQVNSSSSSKAGGGTQSEKQTSVTSTEQSHEEYDGENEVEDDGPTIKQLKPSDIGFLEEKPGTNKTKRSALFHLAWEMKATKTSVIIVTVYLLCWGPIGILYLIDNYCLHCISQNQSRSVDRLIVKVISFMSSILIPLVYCWRTKEFRTDCAVTCVVEENVDFDFLCFIIWSNTWVPLIDYHRVN